MDAIAERIQLLGAVSIAMAADVAETTIIPRPPRGREEVPVQISRLLEAHEFLLREVRTMAKQAPEAGDDGTNDLLVSQIIRTNELAGVVSRRTSGRYARRPRLTPHSHLTTRSISNDRRSQQDAGRFVFRRNTNPSEVCLP